MFQFLKNKLKETLAKISKKAEEEATTEEVEVQVEEKPKEQKKTKQEKKVKEKKEKKEKIRKKKKEVIKEEVIEKHEEIQQKEVKEEKVIEQEKVEEKKGFFSRLFEKKEQEEETAKEKEAEPVEEQQKVITENVIKEPEEKKEAQAPAIQEEKQGFFAKLKQKVVTKKISQEQFATLFWDLELVMMENNVAVEVIEKIKQELQEKLVDKPIVRGRIEETIKQSLREALEDLFSVEGFDLIQRIQEKKEKPFVVVFVGVNGSGKTTTISKIAHLLKEKGLSVVLSASDTFRAAAIQQLKEWGEKLHIKVIAHDYGSDPAAVGFDSIKYAQAHKIDVVLVDTAGRQHSNSNLMREMEKIVRVVKPDVKIFIGESITGNDAVEQAKHFNAAVGIDGIILTKADVDEKGGAIISVGYVTKKPILYLGCGQHVNDLKKFDKEKIIESLGL